MVLFRTAAPERYRLLWLQIPIHTQFAFEAVFGEVVLCVVVAYIQQTKLPKHNKHSAKHQVNNPINLNRISDKVSSSAVRSMSLNSHLVLLGR